MGEPASCHDSGDFLRVLAAEWASLYHYRRVVEVLVCRGEGAAQGEWFRRSFRQRSRGPLLDRTAGFNPSERKLTHVSDESGLFSTLAWDSLSESMTVARFWERPIFVEGGEDCMHGTDVNVIQMQEGNAFNSIVGGCDNNGALATTLSALVNGMLNADDPGIFMEAWLVSEESDTRPRPD